ncbi:unnamed protein product [Rangifer tarandus platyrhynchus]|uniref:Uncharacterized protein n=2 Tax=Rangifer tarandus platyrhynchus TaxID=3082113 RepID=A0ABN8Y7G5_RANTA|nr:unnamed protein product [Rangifer tarandus platyrhynchus]CAI9695354.1 unnamed protein product [Rangifer tarandus platyrhynchus]
MTDTQKNRQEHLSLQCELEQGKRKAIREPPGAGVEASGVRQRGRVTSMALSPGEATSGRCCISSSVPEPQTRLPQPQPAPRGGLKATLSPKPAPIRSPRALRDAQRPSAPPAACSLCLRVISIVCAWRQEKPSQLPSPFPEAPAV